MTRRPRRRGGPKPIRNAWEPIVKNPDHGITRAERQTSMLQCIALLDAACEGDQEMRAYLTPGSHVHDLALMLAQMTDLARALTYARVGCEPGRQREITDMFREAVLTGSGLR
ncbi:hypothetical protein [Blastococcus brunescens]|uniref:Uncharacterized protein n=1 Tax=Blastococcus brunescens TaxID=1564165 RepID=A0ABZ1B3X1_9ACTN|nr:hypothetical protein [Blastococcus sp. BMG 8361]WRL65505.1 hypothetical protein U6N30_07875 [Blastococcus sp. BMG 8361]